MAGGTGDVILVHDKLNMEGPSTPAFVDAHQELYNLTSTVMTKMATDYQSCRSFRFAVQGVVAGLLCIVGLIGNILSLIALRIIGRQSVTFFLLKVLAVVDAIYLLTYAVTSVALQFFAYFDWYPPYLDYFTWGVFPVASMALTCSIWITTLVTIHRFLSVCLPHCVNTMATIQGAALQVAIAGVLSIVLDIPRYFEWKVIKRYTENGTIDYKISYTELFTSYEYQLIYKNITMTFVRKIAPIVLISVLTAKLVTALIKRQIYRNSVFNASTLSRTTTKHSERAEGMTRVLIVIATVFVVCHLPMAIYPIFRLINPRLDSNSCETIFLYFVAVADTMTLLNSAGNFFIYYPFIPAFRRKSRQLFRCPGDVQETDAEDVEMLEKENDHVQESRVPH